MSEDSASQPEASQPALSQPEPETFDVGSVPGGLPAALEAILMVVDEPISELNLASTVGRPVIEVTEALVALQREYDGYTGSGSDADFDEDLQPRGFELRSIAGGWRFYSRSDFAPLVQRFVLEGQTARLTQAALETLAVIAYRQPVSRARISAIRGVNVDSVVRTLTQRGLITELETDPETGAILYGTTSYFLERLGLGSVDELPKIAPHLPGVENLEDFDEVTRTAE
ncbi:segregation and condensation protein [Renibacterium salmoninarum ATCC 33209]|uniref:Segregation and condensation protein n=1 Tax=Renibacterium salmoninarum (strain ATCC 33209 / DSM 20767 / JCM 11484 / NBRC 15589 / NCIMB 2235) TaxID=288705 RepID=A9WRN6_RENSM|nr:SMC-Scp complex subunit ScpB [Renibacterium salmoninarum]ABY24318.1 segregation and condensation protein [Renibacterium salmoninarum ATCC 33209]